MRVWKHPPVVDLLLRYNSNSSVVFQALELYLKRPSVPSYLSRRRRRRPLSVRPAARLVVDRPLSVRTVAPHRRRRPLSVRPVVPPDVLASHLAVRPRPSRRPSNSYLYDVA